MNRINILMTLLLVFSGHIHAQLQLIDLTDLQPDKQHHQMGQVPVFKSALLLDGEPKVVSGGSYDLYNDNNLLAVVNGQFVVFPKAKLAISNGFKPFKNLMNISNGYLLLENRYGVGVWTDPSISNGFLYFRGFASLKSLQLLQETAVTMTLAEFNSSQSSTAVTTDDPNDPDDCWDWGNCDDDEHDFELWWFLEELNRNHNPWDRIMVMVDGVMVEMSVGALGAHLSNGAFRLGGGDGRMPEFP